VELKEKTIAPKVMKTVAEVNKALCKGCGVCAASCRSGAINLKGFTDDQIYEAVSAIRI
jgi:heterodisulfide reductase subunit A